MPTRRDQVRLRIWLHLQVEGEHRLMCIAVHSLPRLLLGTEDLTPIRIKDMPKVTVLAHLRRNHLRKDLWAREPLLGVGPAKVHREELVVLDPGAIIPHSRESRGEDLDPPRCGVPEVLDPEAEIEAARERHFRG